MGKLAAVAKVVKVVAPIAAVVGVASNAHAFATGEKSLGEAVFDTLSPVSADDARYLQETGAAMYSDYVDAGARNIEESRGMNNFDSNTGNDNWVKVTLPDGRVRNVRREDAKRDGYID